MRLLWLSLESLLPSLTFDLEEFIGQFGRWSSSWVSPCWLFLTCLCGESFEVRILTDDFALFEIGLNLA